MDRWISLISGLAAFITALATLYIILEMKKQRASMYLPDLAFPIVGLYLYKNSEGIFFFSTKEKPEETDRHSRVSIEILNVGLGAAKDIVLEWSCDIDKFSNVISNYDPDQDSKITQRNGRMGNLLVFENKNNRLPKMTHMVQNQLKSELTHIIPIHAEPKSHKLTVPPFYLDLYLHYLYHAMYVSHEEPTNSVKVFVLEEPSPLRLTITYKDIGNKSHKHHYEIKPFLYSFIRAENQELAVLSNGCLKVERLR